MTAWLKAAIGLLAALVLTLLLPVAGLSHRAVPDLLLTLVVWFAVNSPPPVGLLVGWSAGVLLAAFASVPAGAVTAGKLVATFVVILAGRLADTNDPRIRLGLVFAATIADGTAVWATCQVLGLDLALAWPDLLLRALVTTLAAVVVFDLADRFSRPAEGRRAW